MSPPSSGSRRSEPPNAPQHIGRLLGPAQREAARAAGVGPVDREAWREVVGDRIANRTVVEHLQAGVLHVRVASSVWAQELSLLAAEITDRLRARRVYVQRIRFSVGVVPELDPVEFVEPPPHPVPLPRDLQDRLATIEDPELARIIAEAASYSLARDALRSGDGDRHASDPTEGGPG